MRRLTSGSLHPLVFADDGSAVQASPEPQRPFTYPCSCFVTGTIKGTSTRDTSRRNCAASSGSPRTFDPA
ncbi:nucleotidyltransferase domain-containing protein [Streptomyces sp. NPDC058441]|uniref:nucleotidyltransferase domain-containing protein n=1 Tax=Streptomyces sp. NPDC058441 TaxID=3346502 RepID=UPI003664532A